MMKNVIKGILQILAFFAVGIGGGWLLSKAEWLPVLRWPALILLTVDLLLRIISRISSSEKYKDTRFERFGKKCETVHEWLLLPIFMLIIAAWFARK